MQAVHGPNASWMNLTFQTFAYQWSFLGTIVSMMSGWPKPTVSTCLCLCGGLTQPEILAFWFGHKNQRSLQDFKGCCPYWAAWRGPSTKPTITNWKRVVIAFVLQKLVVTGLGIVFFGKWTVIGIAFGLALFATSKSLDTSLMQSSTTLHGFQTSVFVNDIVGSGLTRRVNPLILLRNFDMSLIQPCQLHNLNLGLLWTSNGAAVATFGEMGFWGDPNLSLALVVENAWDDFRLFLKEERRHCSQCKFTIKMIFKQNHGAYFSAKGHNSRVLADWLADCAERAWGRNFDGPRLFGKWLQGHPQRLEAALADQQLPHLCLALPPGLPCAILVSTSSRASWNQFFVKLTRAGFSSYQPFDCQDFYLALYGFEWSLPALPEPTQHIMGSGAPSINPKQELTYRWVPWYTNTGIYIYIYI